MTKTEQIRYMKYAAALCHLHFTDEQVDLLVSLYEGVMDKGGEFSLRDAAVIQVGCQDRERVRNTSKMLDKISKKTGSTEPELTKRKKKQ